MRKSNYLVWLRLISFALILYLIWKNTSFTIIVAGIIFIIEVITEVFELVKVRRGRVGSFLTPFTHRIFVLGILLLYYFRGEFHIVILLLYVLRDAIVSYVRWIAARDDAVLRSDYYAKVLNYCQLGIIASLLFKSIMPHIAAKLTIIFVLFSVIMVVLSIVHNSAVYLTTVSRRRKIGRELEHEDIIILANKRARGFMDRYRRRLLKRFARRRKAKIVYLRRNNLFKDIEDKIVGKKHIVIAGGDGTFEGALNHPHLKKKVLGFFPLGAGNAFYSYFYKGKRFEYLRSRFPFRETKIDVLELTMNGTSCETLFMSLGVDADVMRLSHRGRTKNGLQDYVVASLKALFTVPGGYDLFLTVDGKKMDFENSQAITFGKVPYFGYGVRSLLGRMELDDGIMLGLGCTNTHNLLLNKPVRVWGLLLQMMGLHRAPLHAIRGKKIQVTSEIPFPVQAGGEFLGYTQKLNVRVKRLQKILLV